MAWRSSDSSLFIALCQTFNQRQTDNFTQVTNYTESHNMHFEMKSFNFILQQSLVTVNYLSGQQKDIHTAAVFTT